MSALRRDCRALNGGAAMPSAGTVWLVAAGGKTFDPAASTAREA
jgi:hypothetical protein